MSDLVGNPQKTFFFQNEAHITLYHCRNSLMILNCLGKLVDKVCVRWALGQYSNLNGTGGDMLSKFKLLSLLRVKSCLTNTFKKHK